MTDSSLTSTRRLTGETSHARQIRQERVEFERLDVERLALAAQRSTAWRTGELKIAHQLSERLSETYLDWREARALADANGNPGPVSTSMTSRESLTVVPEIVADPVAVFVRERCRLRPDAVTPTVDIKAAYRRWAAVTSAESMSPNAISRRLVRMRGVSAYRTHGVRCYRGIALTRDSLSLGATSCETPDPAHKMEVR